MKFSLFAHMERTSPDHPHQQLYEEFLSLCEIADQSGMHTIWTGEHHGMDFTIAPNPFISLIDLAGRFKNVRLGTGTVVAPFWHPLKLAGEAAMADQISGGRLELGIARGAYSFEYERLRPGMDAWQAGARMRELVPTLRKLWQGDYAHQGEYWNFPSSSSAPKPLQSDGPPIWIAARDPSSHEFALENQCNVQVTPLWLGDEEIETLMQRYQQAVTSRGHGKRSKIMLLQHCYVGKDQQQIEQAVTALHRFYCNFGAWFKNERPVKQARIKPLSDDEINANPMYTPQSIKENLAIGTAAEVVTRLRKFEQLGYDEYAFWVDSGMSAEQKQESLKRFIDEVMPHFD